MRLILLATLALPALAFAQGQLTPPADAFSGGTPTSTMKTLTQVEPRTPLELGAPGIGSSMSGGLIIEAPGSYYLTANLTVGSGNAIDIGASNVTLDLNGYSLLSSADARVVRGSAIEIPDGVGNVTIRNGHIAPDLMHGVPNSGFANGITSGTATGIVVEDVSVSNVVEYGLKLSDTSIVRRCTVTSAGDAGIKAGGVFDSRTTECSALGINCTTAQNCYAVSSTDNAITASTAINSTGTSTDGVGLLAYTTAINSTGTSTDGVGLQAYTIAIGCYGHSTSNIGLQAEQSATGCIGTTNTGDYAILVRPPHLSGYRPGSAENCVGRINSTTSASSVALFAGTATNCTGTNISGIGLSAEVATGCRGTSKSGIGLQATQTATGCYGTTETGPNGLVTDFCGTAENCRGTVTGTGATGVGLAAETATNCFGGGTAGIGLSASTANNCSALSASGSPSMSIAGTANGCRGNSGKAGGNAIEATIAIACTTYSGAIVAPQKHLGTP